jgi:hypothetical protein
MGRARLELVLRQFAVRRAGAEDEAGHRHGPVEKSNRIGNSPLQLSAFSKWAGECLGKGLPGLHLGGVGLGAERPRPHTVLALGR